MERGTRRIGPGAAWMLAGAMLAAGFPLRGGGEGGEPAAACALTKVLIRLQSAKAAEAAGIATEEVRPGRFAETVSANARVAFDGARFARVAPRIPGVVREIRKEAGDDVGSGETLFVIDSQELGEAQTAFLEAVAAAALSERDAERERGLAERSATSERELLAAEAARASAAARLLRAEGRLRSLGLAEEAVARLREERKVSSFLPVASPFAGTVVERAGAVGELADPARPLCAVADLSRVWVMVDLFERDLSRVFEGQEVVFSPDAHPARAFRGKIAWISARVDPDTRTVPVRVPVENPGRLLKENLFGTARIAVREKGDALAVPKGAVQWEGCHHVVFVPAGEGAFQTRAVELGAEGEGVYEVKAGLSPGERVVTTGSFLLKTELLKDSIGEG